MRAKIALVAALVAFALGGILAPPALAKGSQVVADCNANGRLTHRYSEPELQNALNTMGADVKEYTGCYDVIQRALLAAAARGNGSGGADPNSGSGSDSVGTVLIVALSLLGLTAAGFGAVAMRRAIVRGRREGGP